MGFVVERICGICSFMHGMGYCVSLEAIMNVEVPERARWLRLVWAEISRIQSHLLWLGLGADAFGFENLFMHCWRMREQILDIFEKTTGGRIIHSVNRIGGVKRDIADSELAAILAELQELGAAFKETARVFGTDPSIAHRLGGVGHGPDAHQPQESGGPFDAVGRTEDLVEAVRMDATLLHLQEFGLHRGEVVLGLFPELLEQSGVFHDVHGKSL